MNVLQTEIVKSDTPTWVSFKHSIFFVLFFIISLGFLQVAGLQLAILTNYTIDIFGFYFSTPVQGFLLLFLSTLSATLISFFFVRKNIIISTLVNTTLYLSIYALLLLIISYRGSSESHYGQTNMDTFYSGLLTFSLILLEFFVISFLLLKKYKNKIWFT